MQHLVKLQQKLQIARGLVLGRIKSNIIKQSPENKFEKTYSGLAEQGRVYLHQKDFDAAYSCFEQALELASKDQERGTVRRHLGQLLLQDGNHKDALEQLNKAVDECPDEPAILLALGQALAHCGNPQEGLKVCQQAIELNPQIASSHHHLAKVLRNIGQYSKARQSIETALSLEPSNKVLQDFKRLIEGDFKVYQEGYQPTLYPAIDLQNSVRTSSLNEGLAKSGGKVKRSGVSHFPKDLARPSSSLRVLHAIEASLPQKTSGYSFRSHYIFKAQQSLNLEPIISTRPGFPLDIGHSSTQTSELIDGIEYHRLPAMPGEAYYNRQPLDLYLDHYAEHLGKLAQQTRPDLVQATSNFKNGIAAYAVAQAYKIPFVYELRGLWEDTQVSKGVIGEESERYNFFRAMENRCLEQANAVITLSQTLKQEITKRGILPDKIFVVPNAVDCDRFPLVERNQTLAEKLKIGTGPVLGYISSLVSYEGINILLQAFAELKEQCPEARVLIVGEGEQRSSLEALSEELNISEEVIFTGRIAHEQILDYYSVIDIFVVPRVPLRVCEIVTPLKPYEAMSSGRALVVSNVQALKEMVIDQETGIHFKAGNPSSLASACLELCQNKQLRQKLGQNAAKWVRQNRSWQSVSPTYLKAYSYAQRNKVCAQ